MATFATQVEQRYRDQLDTLGPGALNALYPRDFGYSFIALELVDSQGNTVDYFAWPILPDEVVDVDMTLTNVRKTMFGINVQKNQTFNPRTITMRGDFGRKFKVLLGGNEITFAGFGLSIANNKFSVVSPNDLATEPPQFSTVAKNGYGCVKMLESIKDKSKQLDNNGRPFSLFLYNPVLGNNYQVEFVSFRQSQDKDHHNMYPAYNLQLIAVAPFEQSLRQGIKNLTVGYFQKKVNTIASNLRGALKSLNVASI